MSIYSLGASALGGAALAGFITWRVAVGMYAGQLGDCHTQLATSQANLVGLQTAINNNNIRIKADHVALLAAQANAKKLQDVANKNAGQANAKAQSILIYKPGDDYALSSLDLITESLK